MSSLSLSITLTFCNESLTMLNVLWSILILPHKQSEQNNTLSLICCYKKCKSICEHWARFDNHKHERCKTQLCGCSKRKHISHIDKTMLLIRLIWRNANDLLGFDKILKQFYRTSHFHNQQSTDRQSALGFDFYSSRAKGTYCITCQFFRIISFFTLIWFFFSSSSYVI